MQQNGVPKMITWKPSALQKLITDAGITKVNLSSSLEVSRPTLDKWLNGEAAPKGRFLIALSRFFKVKPDIFFTEGTAVLSVMHRTVRKTKVQDKMTDSAKALASEYETFFRNAPDPLISNTLNSLSDLEKGENI